MNSTIEWVKCEERARKAGFTDPRVMLLMLESKAEILREVLGPEDSSCECHLHLQHLEHEIRCRSAAIYPSTDTDTAIRWFSESKPEAAA